MDHSVIALPFPRRYRCAWNARLTSAVLQSCLRVVFADQRRVAWTDLLQRVFEVDALACPKCGGRMRVLAAITDPTVAARILRCLALPARAPPLASSRDEGGCFDSAGDVSFGEIQELDFDQSQSFDDCENSV
jgi:hypothetical protein